MLHRYVLHNDDIVDASEKCLSPGQVGLLSGWGVFSTIRVADGVLFAYDRHWARMKRDAASFNVPFPVDSGQLKRNLLRLVEANHAQNSTLRVVVVRNTGGMWSGPSDRPFDVMALTADTKEWGEGVKLTYQSEARHSGCMFSGTKILSWAMNLRWVEDANARGFDEVILLNEKGEVAECTSANIFAASDHIVWTPPLGSGCLPGVTRELLLSEIHVPGYEIVEKVLRPEDLAAADEVFITSTTRDLLPVLEIDGQPVKNQGGAREALQQAFSAYVQDYVNSHQPISLRK